MPSHMHDDHMNGFPHLIRHHQTQVWCYENMVDVFENPRGHNLGCILGEPFKVRDRFVMVSVSSGRSTILRLPISRPYRIPDGLFVASTVQGWHSQGPFFPYPTRGKAIAAQSYLS